jgi:hypothetical protein
MRLLMVVFTVAQFDRRQTTKRHLAVGIQVRLTRQRKKKNPANSKMRMERVSWVTVLRWRKDLMNRMESGKDHVPGDEL